jgi:hypothetical protein
MLSLTPVVECCSLRQHFAVTRRGQENVCQEVSMWRGRKPSRRDIWRATVIAPLAAPFLARAEQKPVRVLSHRYPALEYYTGKMREAVPNTQVDVQLVPFDKALELTRIALSAGSDSIDILYTTDVTVLELARRGWLRPLFDVWAMFRNEFGLDDFTDTVMRAVTIDGHTYVVPHGITVMRQAAALVMPTRRRLLADPMLAQSSRSWPAAIASLKASLPFPALADFYAIGDGIARRIQEAVTGQMPVGAAMQLAATETAAWLAEHGTRR